MKYLCFLWLLLAGLFSLSPIIFAQSQTTVTVPDIISKNCFMGQSGAIEYCPEYRTQVRDTNTKLFQQRSDAEAKGQITLYDYLNNAIASLRSEQSLAHKQSLSGTPLFLREYEEYLTNLFTQFFNNNANTANIVKKFFKTTYFKSDQSGLGISNLSLYTKKPQRYDQSIILQLSVRNYSPNQMSNIEDVYCFTTLNNQDYIYPINIKPVFKENSITNLIIELKAGISPLLEKIDTKNIACTIAYTQFNEKKYTNRWTLSFALDQ